MAKGQGVAVTVIDLRANRGYRIPVGRGCELLASVRKRRGRLQLLLWDAVSGQKVQTVRLTNESDFPLISDG